MGQLILFRQPDQSIRIGSRGEIKITVVGGDSRGVRLAIDAPREVPIHRSEVFDRIALASPDGVVGPGGRENAGDLPGRGPDGGRDLPWPTRTAGRTAGGRDDAAHDVLRGSDIMRGHDVLRGRVVDGGGCDGGVDWGDDVDAAGDGDAGGMMPPWMPGEASDHD